MKDIIEIDGRKIGEGEEVFVIAEIGLNHNGDFETAKRLIDEARKAGASAVKFQTYITEKRVPKDSPIFGILKECELDFDKQKELFRYADDTGITIFSTPFDDESVDFLASIGAPCYKIASFDIVNKNLLKKVAACGKPSIVSRGMATMEEIDTAVEILTGSGSKIALLHCVSAYPVPKEASLNLYTINALKERYHCPVGFSDHTLGIDAAAYAVAAGASIIEKHFTLSRKAKGPDHALSVEPSELKGLIDNARWVNGMMGEKVWASVEAEKDILQFRRVS